MDRKCTTGELLRTKAVQIHPHAGSELHEATGRTVAVVTEQAYSEFTLSLLSRPQSDSRQATGAWTPRKREMNTLQLIKARTVRNQAIETARTRMARAFRDQGHIDRVHTPVGTKAKVLRYRGVTYQPIDQQQHPSGGRELRYRGVSYDVY
jgi:hypothetical protein